MLICLDCEKIFEEPSYYREKHGLSEGPFECFYGCPYCGGAYKEAYKCDGCDEWLVGEYIKTIHGDRFCENCYNTYWLGDE